MIYSTIPIVNVFFLPIFKYTFPMNEEARTAEIKQISGKRAIKGDVEL